MFSLESAAQQVRCIFGLVKVWSLIWPVMFWMISMIKHLPISFDRSSNCQTERNEFYLFISCRRIRFTIPIFLDGMLLLP